MSYKERQQVTKAMDKFFQIIGVQEHDRVSITVERGAAESEIHGTAWQASPNGLLPAAMDIRAASDDKKAPGGNQGL
jgi:hypothetical protein